jgi:TrmH family RNA methyltransferase
MPSLKDYHKLHLKKYRQEWHLFLVEGWRLCYEALKSDWQIKNILIGEDFHHHYAYSSIQKLFNKKGIEPKLLKNKDLKKIAQTTTPQGIVLVGELPEAPRDFFKLIRKKKKIILLQGIRDPGNLGTIIRTADWFGFQLIMTSDDSADIFNPKSVRASMGSIFRIACFEIGDISETIESLQKNKFFIIGTSPHAGTPFAKSEIPESVALLLGAEAEGVPTELIDKVDQVVSIPSRGEAESLNVAVAAGILMNHFTS